MSIPVEDGRYVLTHKTIGQIRGNFFVPGYQRGYRWDPHDVTRLLDDVCDSEGKDYSLQPIVVKLHRQAETPADQEWELIDGQQRLTTLYLILGYMQSERAGRGAPYSLRYETRKGSETYVKTLDEATHATNIDYFHLFMAYRAIESWFQQHGDEYARNNMAIRLHGYLFNSVRVIWYEAPAQVEAIPLFTRLNVGRIPLTDAELVKAALLSGVRNQSPERAHEIAAQWDGIERDLHNADIWAFVAGRGSVDGDDRYPTRISLLLDTLADDGGEPSRRRPRYYTFDTLQPLIKSDFAAFWNRVVALHAQILGWLQLPAIYNKIGFLVACGYSFGELARAARDQKKSDFDSYLINTIRSRLKISSGDLEDLSYEEKKSGYPKLMELLLLLNVETSTIAKVRFAFSEHVEQRWSLEHIHAQHADLLNKAEQWETWLSTHRLATTAIMTPQNQENVAQIYRDIDAAIAEIASGRQGVFTSEKFNELSMRVLKLLNRDLATDHSIQNLALLSSRDNSRLSNSVFEVKRNMILDLDRKGSYVPVCTRNVFLKYYADADSQQPHFWSDRDRESYLGTIRTILHPYLN